MSNNHNKHKLKCRNCCISFFNVHFQMCPQNACIKWFNVTLVDLSPLCVIKCLLKALAWEDVKSHWLHFFTFLHCVFSNVSSNRLPEQKQSHIGCICLTFLHCAFSNVFSNRLPEKRHNHNGCICLTWWHLHPLNGCHNCPFLYPWRICLGLCPNGCIKPSQIYNLFLFSKYHKFCVYFHFFRCISIVYPDE